MLRGVREEEMLTHDDDGSHESRSVPFGDSEVVKKSAHIHFRSGRGAIKANLHKARKEHTSDIDAIP